VWLDHPLAKPKTARAISIDGRPWTCAGPLMLDEVERLRRLL
jgi:iron complex transport system substrate-binding protein